jgi:hypothetical protein
MIVKVQFLKESYLINKENCPSGLRRLA